jgi:deoxyribodipyrimidine photo-lyase
MTFNRSLIWFRNNLRLKDNEALKEAIDKSREYILLYIFDDALWMKTPIDLPRSSSIKLNFIWESVQNLQHNIAQKEGTLHIRKGIPESIIEEFVEIYNCDAVFAPKEVGTYERAMEESLDQTLSKKGVSFKLFTQSTLFHEDDIPWPISKLPDVFTQFRKENEKQTEIRGILDAPENLNKSVKLDESETCRHDLGISENKSAEKAFMNFQGGEEAAWQRLNYYFWESDQLAEYKITRNGLLGADYSSKFSPWLALGCISAKSIYYEVKRYEKERKKNQSTYWLIFELIWRDYFHFVLKKFQNNLFQSGGIRGEETDWWEDTKTFERWAHGETGVPFIDANMRELNQTGFMSNRGRQNVASFLVKDLGIDWRMGAWYFEYALLDYDVASNWGNWAYVAGVGNDPRENRYFNILSQAKKYDPKGDYVRYWLPELAKIEGFNVHTISLLNKKTYQSQIEPTKIDYFEPMVDMKKW